MSVSIPVPPLHEPKSPPPALPILAAHTSIMFISTEPKKLAAHETLPLNMPITTPSQVSPGPRSRTRSTAPPSRIPSPAPPSRIPSPAPLSRMPSVAPAPPVAKSPTVRFRTVTPDNMSEYSDLTSLPSETESDSSSEGGPSERTNNRRIPKPSGEPGRPSRGGYTLKVVLNWTINDYKKLKRAVYKGIEDHLDHTKSLSFQNSAAVERVRQQVLAECPLLDRYVNNWPFTDILMCTLKSSSAKWRREQQIKGAVHEGEKRRKSMEATSGKKKKSK